MAIKKTLKHELEYNTETSQAIFNDRNTSALAPTHKPLPERFFTFKEENEIKDETIKLSPANDVDEEISISYTTLEQFNDTVTEL